MLFRARTHTRSWVLSLTAFGALIGLLGCEDSNGGGARADGARDASADGAVTEGPFPAAEDWSSDILDIDLTVDVETLAAQARIRLDQGTTTAASFEAGGLTVRAVHSAAGPLDFRVVDGRLDVGLPSRTRPAEIVVDYDIAVQSRFVGLLGNGSTNTWPCCCDNLFPCRSTPSEGQTFGLEVTGVGSGEAAVHPDRIVTDAPAYQLAWAVGDYAYTELGSTTAGTAVGYFALPGGDADAAAGTAHLIAVFDWLERTLGPYPFGDRVGPVAVAWGPEAFLGGMEHHPYWHIAQGSMAHEPTQAHEAVHGWFGDGVRIACWEELVLSEGTVTYLTARAIGHAVDAAAEALVWTSYDRALDDLIATGDRIAWPDGCGALRGSDPSAFNVAAYYKGAFFYRSLAEASSHDAVDAALGSFVRTHVGQAARMQDLLDHLAAETGVDPTALADAWLRSLGRP